MKPHTDQLMAFVQAQGAVSVPMIMERFGLSRLDAIDSLSNIEGQGLLHSTARPPKFWSTTRPTRHPGRARGRAA